MISVALGIQFVLDKIFQRPRTVTNLYEDRLDTSNLNNSSDPADPADEVKDNSINRLTLAESEGLDVHEDLIVHTEAVGLQSKPRLVGEVRTPADRVNSEVDVVNEDLIVQAEAVGLQSKPRIVGEVGTPAERVNSEVDVVHEASNAVDDADAAIDREKGLNDTLQTHLFTQTIQSFEKVPYFTDPRTTEFIRHSNAMFIMRGLPGSGKSTIVKFLQQFYAKSVVCSADDYFLNSNGEYRFDMTKLSEAHASCQNKATEHCENQTPVIIVDNTNIQRWEMSFYLQLAQNRYHTFIVEPRTPWRHDVTELSKRNKHGVGVDVLQQKLQKLQGQKVFPLYYGRLQQPVKHYRFVIGTPRTPWRHDVKELSKRNKHGVSLNVLQQKLQKLQGQKVFPLYYGWFLTNNDSSGIVKMSKDVLSKCVDNLNNVDDEYSLNSLKGILEDFATSYTNPKGMLHCTSKFVGSNTSHQYHQKDSVQASMGRVYNLEISGFVYTGRSISARVNLNSEAFKREAAIELYDKMEEVSLHDRYEGHSKGDQIQTYFRHGCSSHITIKVANDAQSKVSGDDILRICEMGFHGKGTVCKLSHGQLYSFPDGMFYVQLEEPVSCETLFHGYFSTARR